VGFRANRPGRPQPPGRPKIPPASAVRCRGWAISARSSPRLMGPRVAVWACPLSGGKTLPAGLFPQTTCWSASDRPGLSGGQRGPLHNPPWATDPEPGATMQPEIGGFWDLRKEPPGSLEVASGQAAGWAAAGLTLGNPDMARCKMRRLP